MRLGWSISCLVILLVLACQPSTPASTPFPFTITVMTPEPTLNPVNCSTILCCTNCPSVPVVRTIDGDTFESAQGQRVRLFGVNTPERGQPCFSQATERLRQLADRSVGVEFGPRQADQYGRLLYYVYTAEGESVDEILVREGLTLAWEGDGQHRDLLVAAEEGAKRDQRGCLRSDTTMGSSPQLRTSHLADTMP
jgi:endonuclease YncB( thermonuclease family)